MKTSSRLITFTLLLGCFVPSVTAESHIDPHLPAYTPVENGLSGTITSIGSDTLNNQLTLWAEAFRKIYPNVNIGIEGKGSATAPPALIEGTAQIGPMSREMKGEEIDAFVKKFGYQPTLIRVAIDAVAIYVHKDNPLESITLNQIDGAFSATLKRGGPPINTWGDLGLSGDWARQPLSLLGRNSASGTYGFFKDVALARGDFRSTVKEQPGSSSVVQGVAADPFAIGYSGIAYRTSGVRVLPIFDGQRAFAPDYQSSLNGDYPLARFLFVYLNIAPDRGPDLLTREFLRFILSKQGQKIVEDIGYYPLPLEIVNEELKKLGT